MHSGIQILSKGNFCDYLWDKIRDNDWDKIIASWQKLSNGPKLN